MNKDEKKKLFDYLNSKYRNNLLNELLQDQVKYLTDASGYKQQDNFVIDNIITADIGGTSVFYAIGTDFTVSESNLLTINPAATSTPLTIPAATAGASGVTTITITGTVTA